MRRRSRPHTAARLPLLAALGLSLGLLTAPRPDRRPAAAGPPRQDDRSLIIVTTEAIVARSAKLAPFIAQKRARGYSVLVGTEADYGARDEVGLGRARAIRSWLKKVHAPYRYLLLIGDAHPVFGEVPMLRVWPRQTYSDHECGGFALDCRKLETDAYYADLTGRWDKNGNGRYGEHTVDEGPGGLDLQAELIVGRIPAPLGEVAPVDRALAATLAYINQTPEQTAYRKKILFPAAFYYFRGQQMTTYAHAGDVDGADVPEWYIHNHLRKMKGVRYTRLYERAGLVPSRHKSELALSRDNLLRAWAEGQGMVFWFAHGLPDNIARVVWAADRDGDNRADADELQTPKLLRAADLDTLPGDRPGFVVASSCEIGSVEHVVSLAGSLLSSGAAVGVVGSTSVTPGAKSDWEDLDSPLGTEGYGADALGIHVFNGLIAGDAAAAVLAEARAKLGTSGSIEALAGKLMLNYYGDPSLTLYDSAADLTPAPPPAGGCGG